MDFERSSLTFNNLALFDKPILAEVVHVMSMFSREQEEEYSDLTCKLLQEFDDVSIYINPSTKELIFLDRNKKFKNSQFKKAELSLKALLDLMDRWITLEKSLIYFQDELSSFAQAMEYWTFDYEEGSTEETSSKRLLN